MAQYSDGFIQLQPSAYSYSFYSKALSGYCQVGGHNISVREIGSKEEVSALHFVLDTLDN